MTSFFLPHAGFPKVITTEEHTVFACLGCTVSLPSNIRVSALDAQGIVWSRIKQAVTEKLNNNEINPDYSLTMTNLVRGDTGTYFATATNVEGAINGPSVQLTVIEKPSESLCVLPFAMLKKMCAIFKLMCTQSKLS